MLNPDNTMYNRMTLQVKKQVIVKKYIDSPIS